MIDIHSHVLWGLDDGPAAIEHSIAMIQAAAESGTTDIVATPHLNAEYAYQVELTDEKIRELCEKTGGIVRIHRGCEFHLNFDNLDHLLESPRTYTISGKQYLLLECPDQHVGKHAESILSRLLDSGIVPVIAHPERNPVLQQDPSRLEKWVDLGCLAQVTSLSFTGIFGRSAAAASIRLFERGLVHVIASDSHDPEYRHARLDKARAAVSVAYGEDAAEILFVDNPRCIIEGLPVPGGRQSLLDDSPRPWWQFWKPRSA
jgi:protein-tyrosine phosphatase